MAVDPTVTAAGAAPLKVLLVTNTYPTADDPGATPCVRDQVEALRDEHGVEIDVLHIDHRRKGNYLRAALRVLALNLGRWRYDLVHAHYGHAVAIARLQLRYPVVATFHGCDLLSRREGAIGRWLARRVGGVIVMSEQMKRASGRTDTAVIPFGVDTKTFYPMPRAEARARLGLAAGRYSVLFPYDPRRPVKRFDVLGATVDVLRARGLDVDVITVHSQTRERMRDFMNAADVMVLTSDSEGSPMAVREALVCGLPVVAVDVGDVADLISGIDGCALARQEPRDLADEVQRVLLRGRRLDVAQSARALDAAAAARKVLAVYRQVLGRRPEPETDALASAGVDHS
jgi:glycosyltransferase involved in cell wall biosynthesis